MHRRRAQDRFGCRQWKIMRRRRTGLIAQPVFAVRPHGRSAPAEIPDGPFRVAAVGLPRCDGSLRGRYSHRSRSGALSDDNTGDPIPPNPSLDSVISGATWRSGSATRSRGIRGIAAACPTRLYALPPHRREHVGPEEVPVGIIADIRESGAQAHPGQLPSLPLAIHPEECRNVIVGVGVAEGLAGVEEVRAIQEGNCALGGRFAIHGPIGKNNPARGLSACRAGSKYT